MLHISCIFHTSFSIVENPSITEGRANADFARGFYRELSREMNLPTWDKPSYACLATRIPFGDMITIDKLQKIEEAISLDLQGYVMGSFKADMN